ncbi:MAG: PDZ domain-containing protein [Bacteroidetes bacterium]|nr:PDZ domain-containing protein [Bacteroidota bacterium]
MNYKLSFQYPSTRYINFEITAENISGEATYIQLPSWRPGRYELGNFAKNVRNFQAWNEEGKEISAMKITKDKWELKTKGVKRLKITYEYFASELNAGSTFLDDSQLYVNPVNCCVYIPDRINEECSVELKIPDGWKTACALKKDGEKKLFAKNFDELADSPFISSPTIKHNYFILDGVEFHLWFQGVSKPEWSSVISDFFIFINEQMCIYKTFPSEHYHFLFQVMPQRIHHGVEHTASTVIALGPAHKLMGEVYNEFLGVSCHELFHAWNIKSIRPAEMLPYDYTKENYSRLGYVCEGVTTYYGDYLLLRSGVWTEEEFWPAFHERMQKHFESHARYFLSVAESSFDTWLDGYVPGAPHRKTSIYHEGCLLAFVTDIFIRKNTSAKKSLDDVMRKLWTDFALKGRGYTEADYKKLVEETSGADFSYYWNNFFYKANDYEPVLREAFAVIGCELEFAHSRRPHEDLFGFKITEPNGATRVSEIYYHSPAEKAGLSVGDEIISVNGIQLKADMAEWLRLLGKTEIEFVVTSGNRTQAIKMKSDGTHYYSDPRVKRTATADETMKMHWKSWSGRPF